MDVDASATAKSSVEDLWRILYDEYEDISRWFSGCSGSGPIDGAGDGKGRFVKTKAGRVEERVVELDASAHRLKYSIAGMPFFVKRASSSWSLEPDGDATRVAIRMSVEVMPVIGWLALPVMRLVMGDATKSLVKDLARYAETREIA